MLEYNDQEALILAASITRKRIKNVKHLLKLGHQDCMQVIQVDAEQGFVDLSKRVLSPDDAVAKRKEFDKAKIVHLIFRLTAYNLKCKLIKLYEDFGWDLYDKFDHAYDALKLCLTEPELVFSKVNITEEQKTELLKNVTKKMAPQPMKLRTCFSLKCFTEEGVEAIKESMIEAKKKTSDEKFTLSFKIIAPPEYQIEVTTLDKNGGKERLELALKIVEEEIVKREGIYKLVSAPQRIGYRVGDVDFDAIKANMERNEENSDDDESANSEDNDEAMNVDLEADDIEND